MRLRFKEETGDAFFMKKLSSGYAGRLLSTLFGVALAITIIRSLDFKSFAIYQISFVIGALISWTLDFGLVGAFINFRANLEEQNSQWCLNMRFLSAFTAIAVGVIIHLVFDNFSLYVSLILTSYLDNYVDNFLSARQLFSSMNKFFLTSFGKKIAQLSLLFLAIRLDNFNLYYLSLSLILPNVVILLIDFQDFPISDVRDMKFNRTAFKVGFGNWIQSGGTLIAQLDNVIAFARIEDSFLKVLAASRRISSAVGLIGSTYSPHMLYSAANQNKDLTEHTRIILKISILIMIAFVLPLVIFSQSLFRFLFNIELQPTDIWTVYAILVTIPFGIISANLNAILSGNRRFSAAAAATYVSSFSYLTLLLLFLETSRNWLALGIFINIFLEILIEVYFIHKFKIINFREVLRSNQL